MTAWLEDAPQDSCEHFPNDRGTACASCGIPAEMVPPDELAEALYAELQAAIIRDSGQLGMFGDGDASYTVLFRPTPRHYTRVIGEALTLADARAMADATQTREPLARVSVIGPDGHRA